jgi:RNA polymerase sigma factor (TIGR02999 family)
MLPSVEMNSVTDLLARWSAGDPEALTELIPVVYQELRQLARYHLSLEGPACTLQATALVHEAYLRLVDQTRMEWSGRAHFFGAAAQVMRRVLVDRARERKAHKRGDGVIPESLDVAVGLSQEDAFDVIALDEALNKLAEFDPSQVRVIELRYFGGLSVKETAAVMEVSEATIKRDWALARAWLYRSLSGATSATLPPPEPMQEG